MRKKGDLVYIPAEVSLYKMKLGIPYDFRMTQKPCNAVILDSKKSPTSAGDMYKIFYDGHEWYVLFNDVFQSEKMGTGDKI